MGYHYGHRTYRLTFDGTELDGLEIRARGMSIDERLRIQKAPGDQLLIDTFVDRLIEWNLEDENGDPVPVDRENAGSEYSDLVLTAALTWMREVSGVRHPLGRRSSNGQVEAGIQMMDLPPSQSS